MKTLRPELPEGEKVRFLQEAAIMGQFSHPYVVKLYGVVTVGDPVSSIQTTTYHMMFEIVYITSTHIMPSLGNDLSGDDGQW